MVLRVSPNRRYHFSPLRYPGGKTSLYPLISDLLEKNKNGDMTYIEPYAGGSGTALALLMMEKVSNIIINDYDKAIYSFWKSILNNTDRFINKINSIDVSIKEWGKQRRIYENSKSEFSLGFATFFLNRTNYSGVITARPIGGFEQKGQWKIDARFNKRNLIERIERISYFKNRIKVHNEDGLKLINKFSRRNDVFVYLDPPYYVKGGELYLNSYEHADHVALSKSLKSKKTMQWLLTYDNVSEINTMYKGQNIVPFEINYSANKTCRGKEVMVFSKSMETPRYIR
ncbi:MAG: DNA adenine methylase [Proteobacteria bacterium]|nr:DNA adenine methylase [Pseudomonadota bacterium]